MLVPHEGINYFFYTEISQWGGDGVDLSQTGSNIAIQPLWLVAQYRRAESFICGICYPGSFALSAN